MPIPQPTTNIEINPDCIETSLERVLNHSRVGHDHRELGEALEKAQRPLAKIIPKTSMVTPPLKTLGIILE